MDINKLLEGRKCTCGKTHRCAIKAVYIERNAICRLGELCKNCSRLLIVADQNTYAAAGRQTEEALIGIELERVIFDGSSVLVPNETAVAAVEGKLDGIDMIIGIGSGVVQDLCKYVSSRSGVPYMVAATAPSMDGYASDGAAMIMGGMKVTYPAALPAAIVADTEVLKNAPMDMIQAGYGDIVGKFSALCDWKLSKCVNGEYFCQWIYDLTMEQVERVLGYASLIAARDEQAIGALMESLVIVGILMSFATSSRPASGSEHHLSHFFEITGILDNTPYFAHGIDVAYSTVVTAEIRERLLKCTFPKKAYRPDRALYEQKMREIYKTSADGCIALQDKTGRYKCDPAPIYLQKEQEIRAILSEMPSGKQIKEYLSAAGLDINEFYKMYGSKKIADAVLYAKELKDRYTVLWMNYDFFGGEQSE